MIYYYIVATIISFVIVLTSYFAPDAIAFLGSETSQFFANSGMNLLWIVLFIKPVFMILLPYTELKTNTFSGLWEYLKTIRGRSFKGLRYMVLSIIYFVAAFGMKWRRLLGITTFLLLFTHGGINVGHRLHDSYTLASQLNAFWILTGYISLACLLVGYITSNNFSIRLFKTYWKPIQSLAYVALIFGILHIAFLDFAEYGGYIVLLAIYIFSKLIEKKKITIHWEKLFSKKENMPIETPQKDMV